jgi:hypothetical protein
MQMRPKLWVCVNKVGILPLFTATFSGTLPHAGGVIAHCSMAGQLLHGELNLSHCNASGYITNLGLTQICGSHRRNRDVFTFWFESLVDTHLPTCLSDS